MFKVLAFTLLSLTIAASVIYPIDEICTRSNEVYRSCGTACPETCSNIGRPIVCIAVCRTGCFCKAGYVRNSSIVNHQYHDYNQCVEWRQCFNTTG
uniref:Putative til domain-containing cysteine-rich salivary secreted peptide n=1 Tax=Psorophora albipes TaxID=869069 RepID=T1D5L4_9DIPT